MSELHDSNDPTVKRLRCLARGIGTLLVAGWLFTGIVGALFERGS